MRSGGVSRNIYGRSDAQTPPRQKPDAAATAYIVQIGRENKPTEAAPAKITTQHRKTWLSVRLGPSLSVIHPQTNPPITANVMANIRMNCARLSPAVELRP